MTTTAGYDHYDYTTQNWQKEYAAYRMGYDINQYYLKMDFNHSQLRNHKMDWGWKAMVYDINPGHVKPHGTQSLYMPKTLEKEKALEAALYLNEEWDISSQLTANLGIRYSLFNAFGPRTIHPQDFEHAGDVTYRHVEIERHLHKATNGDAIFLGSV